MATLQNIDPGIKGMAGVGDFGRPYQVGTHTYDEPLPPLDVSEDIARQYDTEEMRALGWRVIRESGSVRSLEQFGVSESERETRNAELETDD